MGLETRKGRVYFYEKVREGERVLSRYVGGGALALDAAKLAQIAKDEKGYLRQKEKSYRVNLKGIDSKIDNEYRNALTIIAQVLRSLGFHNHKGQWRKKRMKTKEKDGKRNDPVHQFIEVYGRVRDSNNPKQRDIEDMKRLAIETPALWPVVARSPEDLRKTIIETMSKGIGGQLLFVEIEIQKKQFNFEDSTALEKMIIEQLLTAKIRLLFPEHEYNRRICDGSFTLPTGRFWMDFLESAQKRFLRVSEALARVQRLTRMTPALQINIAHAGSKQVNLVSQTSASSQGDYKPIGKHADLDI